MATSSKAQFEAIQNGQYNGQTYKKKKYKNDFEAIQDGQYTVGTYKPQDIAPVQQEEKSFFADGYDFGDITKTGLNILSNVFNKNNRFKDGYQIGDVSKTLLGSAIDIERNLRKGAASTVEGATDFGINLLSGLFDEDTAQSMRNFAQKDITGELSRLNMGSTFGGFYKIADLIDSKDIASLNPFDKEAQARYDERLQRDSLAGDTADQLAQGVGQLGGQVALQSLGIPWQFTAFTSSAGNEMNNAFQNNATYGQAFVSGLISGAVEVGSEYLGGGANKFLGMTSLGSKAIEKLGGKISNKLVAMLTKAGLDMAGEGLEEVLSGYGTAIGQKLTYMTDKEINELYSSDEALEEFISGALVSGIANIPGNIQSAKRGENAFTGMTDNEQKVYDKLVEERTKEAQEKSEKKLTKKQIEAIENDVMDDFTKGNISTDKIESILGHTDNVHYMVNQAENMSGRPLTPEELNDINLEAYNNYAESIQKDDIIKKNYYEDELRHQKFNVDLDSLDDNMKKFYQTQIDEGVVDNSTKAHNYMDMMAKIWKDKGIMSHAITDEIATKTLIDDAVKKYMEDNNITSLTTEQRQELENKYKEEFKDTRVNGYMRDGELYININSKNALETIVGHEITHLLEKNTDLYDNLRKSLKEYAESKGEYKNRLDAIKNQPGYNNLTEDAQTKELTADLVGDYIFTSQDYINSLAQNRNLFQKIYDEIKYLVKQVTAGSKEERKLNKAMKMFEKAYKEMSVKLAKQETNTSDIQYSLTSLLQDDNINITTDINNDFFKEHETDFDKNNGKSHILYDNYGNKIEQTTNVYKLKKGNNLAKLSTTLEQNVDDNYGKLYIDELYVKNKSEGLGTEIINSLKQYAKENNLEIHTMKELGNPKTQKFWNSVTEQDFGLDEIARQLYSPYQPGYNISKTDSNGNKLSYQQRQYFKDSKVVDENRNLLELYHGTEANVGLPENERFTIFDRDKAGNNGTYYGAGFYFTSSLEYANDFAKGKGDIYKVYLNITNPYIPSFDTINEDGSVNFAPSFYEDFENRFKKDISLITDWDTLTNKQKGRAVRNILQDNGYDGIINGNNYIAFEPEQIKSVDNKTPTDNPDIRYSLSQPDVDNQGNEVNQNMKEFMVNSYAREDNDLSKPLVKAYHGTTGGEFTIFDNSYGNVEGDFGKGFYFSSDLGDVEQNYEDGGKDFDMKVSRLAERIESEQDIPYEEAEELAREQLYQGGGRFDVYLNITKPAIVGETRLFSYEDYISDIEQDLQDEAENYQDEINEYAEEYDMSFEEARDDYLREQGIYDEIVNRYLEDDIENAVDTVRNNLEIYNDDELRNILWESVYDGGIEVQALKDKINNQLEISDENGDLANNEAVRLILESLGYDGIIDNTVSDKFQNMGLGSDTTHYIVFNSNQIKNVDNTNPTENPDINLSLSRSDEIAPTRKPGLTYGEDIAYQENIAPTGIDYTIDRDIMDLFHQEIARKGGKKVQLTKPVIAKEKSNFRKSMDTLSTMFVNQNTEIDNLAKESGNKNIKFAGDMLNNYSAEAQNDVAVAQTDNYGNAIGKSVQQLFEPAKAKGLEATFNDYLINYSNIDRWARGKGSQTPVDVSERLVKNYEEQHPEFKKWAKDIWKYGENVRNNWLEAGMIKQSMYDLLSEAYPHYVPYISDTNNFDAAMDKLKELKARPIKRAVGGATELFPVEEALTRYTFAQKRAYRQNELFKQIYNTLQTNPGQRGADVGEGYFTGEEPNLYRDDSGNYITALFDGEEHKIQVSDDLFKSLRNDMQTQIKDLENKLSIITKPLQTASNIRRKMLTSWSPSFTITNPLKDIQDAFFNSKHLKGMAKNYIPGIKELWTGSTPEARQFLALYGEGNLMGQFENESGLYDAKKGNKNNKFLKGLSKVNNIMELAPRYAEFKASLQAGESLAESMYNAREITTNFSRGGVITKALNRNGFTFLNASVQGFDKFIRNFSGENGARGIASSLLRAAMLGVAPAVFNELAFGGGDDKDEEYDALPDYIKDNYYLIKVGYGSFVRIPKGRMLSVFGSAARRTIELAEGEENAFEGYLSNVNNQIGINNPEENNIFSPLIQAYGSENGTAWYGGDIVPTRLQDKPKGEQYDASTDKMSIWLGEHLGISPYKINYVLDQYTGGIGDILLPMITDEATSNGSLLAPVVDKFTADSTTDNKYVSDFYTKNDELKVQANSSKATDDDYLRNQYMYNISKEMGKLYAERRDIQADNSLSKSEKYEKSQAIKDQINKLAKYGLDSYDNISVTGNYAQVGDDMGYYKNAKGNWTPIDQKDIESTESIGLTDREKSTYYGIKNDMYNIDQKYESKLKTASDEEKTVLNAQKKVDIINSIKKANLPDSAKAKLYDKKYASTETLDAVINCGIDFDSYLDLQAQNFTADKNIYGKTINGSKKNKVYNYINNLNMPYEQKIMLAKLEYKSDDTYNREIIDYLNNDNSISYQDMTEILKAMGFKVDEYGNITWE